MDLPTLLLLSGGLAMDAFAVSVSNGMCCRRTGWREGLLTALAFGAAQGIMPVAGFLAGCTVSGAIERIDHWIVLFLLSYIGGRMIREGLHGEDGDWMGPVFSGRMLFLQAIATSIDALAVGVSLALMGASIGPAALCIAAVTFGFCLAGHGIGRYFGGVLRQKAAILGGLVLVALGVRLCLEHLFGR